MIVYPAIDIKEGKVVRLKKGDFDKVTEYFDEPVDAANKWIEQGAKYLHVVDLDGAREGRPVNNESIKSIVDQGVEVQLGGGLRSLESLEAAFKLGVKRAIMGTAFIKDRGMARIACKQFGTDRIVAGVDLKEGIVAVEGWQEGAKIGYQTLLDQLSNLGIKNIIVTDVSKDGMQSGPNFSLFKNILSHYDFNVVASGGVSTLDDIKKLTEMNLAGTIVGTAFYEESFSLKEALEVTDVG
ncbi:MAG TPA: 1-(5-phosphoribosyl)-5-[(5-phosphoribosylamino)methylideneamino]imidazole-4-carboxamide isomerase [Actinobacteria bacterium]|nr:1-(5-phosphoribosyl)-5-[(5-phosphoribosylamino)methylideneamino]imidazole-4-carboxamide isomerase [Actinomycetota bacterium]